MKKKFKFQIENGYIYEGPFEIVINNHIAEIEADDITIAIEHVIEAHGGQEMKEEPSKLIATSKFRTEVEFEVKHDSTSA